MPDYQLGKIYKIVCNITQKIYIGSTAQKYISTRLQSHKGKYKLYKEDSLLNEYCSSYEILKNENFKIILIEKYPCNDKMELYQRERYWYDLLDCVNKLPPCTSSLEKKQKANERNKRYRISHKEQLDEYRINNRDKIREQDREYYSKKKHKLIN